MPHTHSTRRYLQWLGLLIIVVLATLLASWYTSSPAAPTTTTTPAFPKDAPAPTPKDYVTAQKGFQYLVSYTRSGFVPATLSVKKGETVRFTNNTTGILTLNMTGVPATTLAHGAYLEHTFSKIGSFTFSDGTQTGTVTVK